MQNCTYCLIGLRNYCPEHDMPWLLANHFVYVHDNPHLGVYDCCCLIFDQLLLLPSGFFWTIISKYILQNTSCICKLINQLLSMMALRKSCNSASCHFLCDYINQYKKHNPFFMPCKLSYTPESSASPGVPSMNHQCM